MPAIRFGSSSQSFLPRDGSPPSNGSAVGLEVICAFPVSGQYGPGARILYYVLVSACIFAQRSDLLRQACLAAALLLPAITAVHGIVLAIFHIPGAIDLDIYGALQICAIGVLAAPVTANRSSAYASVPGRNLIFLWTLLVLAGLLSLTVEFMRTGAEILTCIQDSPGHSISSDPSQFPYGTECGLPCDPNTGPFSVLRLGSANNIYVVPVPHILTFGTATIFAAACCIPAILTLGSMLDNILLSKGKARYRKGHKSEKTEHLEGSEHIDTEKSHVSKGLRKLLTFVEVPFFGAAVISIVLIGEINFWSGPVNYQTEYIASIGQWAPIAGTVFALLGSIYLMKTGSKSSKQKDGPNPPPRCPCCGRMHEVHSGQSAASLPSSDHSIDDVERSSTQQMSPHTTQNDARQRETDISEQPVIEGSRLKFATKFIALVDRLATPSDKSMDDTRYIRGDAGRYLRVPGEKYRSRNLDKTEQSFLQVIQPRREESIAPRRSRESSRADSVRSDPSISGHEGQTPRSPTQGDTLFPPMTYSGSRRSRVQTHSDDHSTLDLQVTSDSGSTEQRNLASLGRRVTVGAGSSPQPRPQSRRNTFSEFIAVTTSRRRRLPILTVSTHPDVESAIQRPEPSQPHPMR